MAPSPGKAASWSWPTPSVFERFVGTHRVQRVPDTEKRGRRHTSTVIATCVADVEVRVSIDHADVRVDTYRSSGAGGQHRNTTDSSVRLTHVPTGVVVTATEERSQHANRQVAWRRLSDALERHAVESSSLAVNAQRSSQFAAERDWVWCGWRDSVTAPNGATMSMKRALRRGLDRLVR